MSKTSKRPARPLSLDPTRTGMLRKVYEREMTRRFNHFKMKLLARLKSLDLTANARKVGRINPDKLDAFNQWVKAQIDEDILEARGSATSGWTIAFTKKAYDTGMVRAHATVRSRRMPKLNGPALKNSTDEFALTNQRTSLGKIRVLASRAYEDLKGVTQSMSSVISRELVNGALAGLSYDEIGDAIASQIDMSVNRARLIAREETTRAYVEASLDTYELMGVQDLGVTIEWSTTGTPCKLCAPLKSMRLTVEMARGMFPRHIGCKCIPIPSFDRIDPEATIEAIEESVDEETGNSDWAGGEYIDDLEEIE